MRSIEYEDLMEELGWTIEQEKDIENRKIHTTMIWLLGRRQLIEDLLRIMKENTKNT